jgi:integrase
VHAAIVAGKLREVVLFDLGEDSKSRVRHLTRSEAARIIWQAYSYREIQKGHATKKRSTLHAARFIIVALYTGSRAHRFSQASFYPEPGRPYVDVDAGLYHRKWEGEDDSLKRAPPIRIPQRLRAHLRRWKGMGARYVVEWRGRAADPKKSFRNVVRREHEREPLPHVETIVRHALRHTCATWLMQAGLPHEEIADYLGMTVKTLKDVYGHHHPGANGLVGAALTTGRAGRTAAPDAAAMSLARAETVRKTMLPAREAA